MFKYDPELSKPPLDVAEFLQPKVHANAGPLHSVDVPTGKDENCYHIEFRKDILGAPSRNISWVQIEGPTLTGHLVISLTDIVCFSFDRIHPTEPTDHYTLATSGLWQVIKHRDYAYPARVESGVARTVRRLEQTPAKPLLEAANLVLRAIEL